MDAAGGSERRLTRHPALDAQPAWSPNGRNLAFTSDRDGDLEIYVKASEGSPLRRLTENGDDDYHPA